MPRSVATWMGEENARLCEHAAVCLLFLSGNDCWLTASYATAPEKQLSRSRRVCVTLDLSQSLSPSLSPRLPLFTMHSVLSLLCLGVHRIVKYLR